MSEHVHSVVEERQAMSTRWESSTLVNFIGALKWGHVEFECQARTQHCSMVEKPQRESSAMVDFMGVLKWA